MVEVCGGGEGVEVSGVGLRERVEARVFSEGQRR